MTAPRLMEGTIDLVLSTIQAGIKDALAAVRADRGDSAVSTEAPPTSSYFIYAGAKAYRCPAVFVVGDDFDNQADKGANYIHANARVITSVVLEDRKADMLTVKAYRYQSALHSILHLANLTSPDNRVNLKVKVSRVAFSPEFSDSTSRDVPSGVFRKEVAVHLDIVHIESLL